MPIKELRHAFRIDEQEPQADVGVQKFRLASRDLTQQFFRFAGLVLSTPNTGQAYERGQVVRCRLTPGGQSFVSGFSQTGGGLSHPEQMREREAPTLEPVQLMLLCFPEPTLIGQDGGQLQVGLVIVRCNPDYLAISGFGRTGAASLQQQPPCQRTRLDRKGAGGRDLSKTRFGLVPSLPASQALCQQQQRRARLGIPLKNLPRQPLARR